MTEYLSIVTNQFVTYKQISVNSYYIEAGYNEIPAYSEM